MQHSLHTLPTLIRGKCRGLIHQTHSGDRHNSGVTLIEMLVSLVIMTLITGSVYVAFNSGKQSWQVGNTLMQKYQNARGALDMMSREISAMYFTVSNVYQTGLIYDSSNFRFIAQVPQDDDDWDLRLIGFRYDSGDKEIERGFATDFTTISSPSSWQPLVSNVNWWKIKMWDDSGTSYDTWDSTPTGSESGKLPNAVEITIAVQDDKQLASEQTFTTVVYIPESRQNE